MPPLWSTTARPRENLQRPGKSIGPFDSRLSPHLVLHGGAEEGLPQPGKLKIHLTRDWRWKNIGTQSLSRISEEGSGAWEALHPAKEATARPAQMASESSTAGRSADVYNWRTLGEARFRRPSAEAHESHAATRFPERESRPRGSR